MTEETQKIIEQVLNNIRKDDIILKEADFQSGAIEFSMTGELIPFERLPEYIEKALELQQKEFKKMDVNAFENGIFVGEQKTKADILEIINKLPANVLNDYKKDILKEKINNLK